MGIWCIRESVEATKDRLEFDKLMDDIEEVNYSYLNIKSSPTILEKDEFVVILSDEGNDWINYCVVTRVKE